MNFWEERGPWGRRGGAAAEIVRAVII